MANNNSVWGGGMIILPLLTGSGAAYSAFRWLNTNNDFAGLMTVVLTIATVVIVVSINRSK